MSVLKAVFGFQKIDLLKLNFKMKSYLLLGFFFLVQITFSQGEVNWSIKAHEGEKNRQSIEIFANIQPDWHLYSSETPKNAGPIPISVQVNKNKLIRVKSDFIEKSKAIKKFDANFDSDVFIFEDEFHGEFKVKVKKETFLSVTVTYMVCNEIMCLPPVDEILLIKLNAK
jgi:hypothetical protein